MTLVAMLTNQMREIVRSLTLRKASSTCCQVVTVLVLIEYAVTFLIVFEYFILFCNSLVHGGVFWQMVFHATHCFERTVVLLMFHSHRKQIMCSQKLLQLCFGARGVRREIV